MEFRKLIKNICFELLLLKNKDVSFFYFERGSQLYDKLSTDNLGFICVGKTIYRINKNDSAQSKYIKAEFDSFEGIKIINKENLSFDDVSKFIVRKKISQKQFLKLMELEQIPMEIQSQIDQTNINRNIGAVNITKANKI